MSPLTLRRYRAERLLAKEFAGLRSKVLSIVRSKLRACGATLDVADLEACYAQAWHGLYAAVLDGDRIENPTAWLVLVTFRRAIDEVRSPARSQPAAQGGEQAVGFDPDIAGALDATARLRHLFEGLRTHLSDRECEVASLCYLQGLSRSQAAERMGISQARMRKLMDGASPDRPGVAGKVGELLHTIGAGDWCERQSSLMRAYAFGILAPGGERHTLAAAHCRECPACRAHVASLRGLAAILPPLPLPLAIAGGVGAGATASIAGRGAASAASKSAGAGWSGLGGPLAVKLAVSGLIVLGGGYAVLEGHAHAHAAPSPRRPALPPVALVAGSPHKALPAPSRHVRPLVRPSRPAAHPARTERARAGGSHAPEFSPERVASAAPLHLASTPASGQRRAGGSSREFGFE